MSPPGRPKPVLSPVEGGERRSVQHEAPASRVARFVTLEGIDGAGKSSHLEALAARLAADGGEVVITREPGGTPLAEELRSLVLQAPMDALTEVLLVFAARRDHLQQRIEPALARGATVLCDRYTDASYAYQGGGRRLEPELLRRLEGWVQQGRQPDFTLWFDLPAEVAAARRAEARSPDRFERQDLAFFERVRAAYAARRAADPARFAVIDALRPRAEVWSQIEHALAARGW